MGTMANNVQIGVFDCTDASATTGSHDNLVFPLIVDRTPDGAEGLVSPPNGHNVLYPVQHGIVHSVAHTGISLYAACCIPSGWAWCQVRARDLRVRLWQNEVERPIPGCADGCPLAAAQPIFAALACNASGLTDRCGRLTCPTAH